jgi:hypothetical protein
LAQEDGERSARTARAESGAGQQQQQKLLRAQAIDS